MSPRVYPLFSVSDLGFFPAGWALPGRSTASFLAGAGEGCGLVFGVGFTSGCREMTVGGCEAGRCRDGAAPVSVFEPVFGGAGEADGTGSIGRVFSRALRCLWGGIGVVGRLEGRNARAPAGEVAAPVGIMIVGS